MKALTILLLSCLSVLAQSPLITGSGIGWTKAASGPSFNPNSLSPVLWVDINSNVINHAGSSSPANNDTIKAWLDCSANGMSLTNLGGATVEPIYKTSGGPPSGSPIISFTGGVANQSLTNRVTTSFAQANSFYFVINMAGGTSGGILNCCDSQNTQINYDSSTGLHFAAPTDVLLGNRLNLCGVSGWGIVCFEFNGATSFVYTNNISSGVAQNVNVGGNAMKGITIGAFFNGGGPSPMTMTDLIWFNSVLSAANRTNVFKWLSTKRGITLP